MWQADSFDFSITQEPLLRVSILLFLWINRPVFINDCLIDVGDFLASRFYIMHLQKRELNFHTITHHASVTQCLGSVGGDVWYLGVSRPSILNEDEITTASAQAKKVVRSKCQHYYVPPHPDDLRVFRISGSKFVKLHTGTWHAGPLFDVKAMDFYNLELSDTNVRN